MAKKMKTTKTKRDPKKVKENLGTFIKEKRLKKGLSQAELADRLGYASPQFVSDWERAVSSPPIKKLPEISKELGVNLNTLFDLLVDLATTQLKESLNEEFSKIG